MTHYTRPNFQRSALITIDTQCDTLDGQPLEIAGTSAALKPMAALVQAYRDAGRPIVHVVRIYRADGTNVDLCRREAVEQGAAILAAGSPGCEIAPALLPSPDTRLDVDALLLGQAQVIGPHETILYKPRWGAFFQTTLEDQLHEMQVDTLVFAGRNFPNCPRTSIYQASERDFRIAVAADALSGLKETGTAELRGIGNIKGARGNIHFNRIFPPAPFSTLHARLPGFCDAGFCFEILFELDAQLTHGARYFLPGNIKGARRNIHFNRIFPPAPFPPPLFPLFPADGS